MNQEQKFNRAIINQAITHEVQPQIIPGLELIDGVPEVTVKIATTQDGSFTRAGQKSVVWDERTRGLATKWERSPCGA